MTATGATARPSRHADPTRRQQAIAAWVLAIPFVALFLVFTAGPVLASLGMSFTDMRSTDTRTPFAVAFVGFDGGAAGQLADVTVHIHSHDYGLVEDVHSALGHAMTVAVRQALASSTPG